MIDNKQHENHNEFRNRSFSFGKPPYKDDFKQDIANNIKNRTNDFTIPMYINGIIEEAIMYSCDICLHFKENSGILPNDWTKHIIHEVCDATQELFYEFNDMNRAEVETTVLKYLSMGIAQEKVNAYYFR